MLTERFDKALVYARLAHAGQCRKGGIVPYFSHLMGVCAIALEHGASEEEAIAALLHDVVEDAGGVARLADVRDRFGETIAKIVDECTDTLESPKPPWKQRKQLLLKKLENASPSGQFVSCCDKLHNCRSISHDLVACGERLWNRFNGGREGSLWYYESLVTFFLQSQVNPTLVNELERTFRGIKVQVANSQ